MFLEFPDRLDVAHVPGRPARNAMKALAIPSYLARMFSEQVSPAQANTYVCSSQLHSFPMAFNSNILPSPVSFKYHHQLHAL